jgi:arsenate reductase
MKNWIQDQLPMITESKTLKVLASNGNLVKHPFVLGENWGAVSFKEEN